MGKVDVFLQDVLIQLVEQCLGCTQESLGSGPVLAVYGADSVGTVTGYLSAQM